MEKELISKCSLFLKRYNVNVFKLNEWYQTIENETFSGYLYMEIVDYFAIDVLRQDNSFASSNSNLKITYFLENELYRLLSSEKNRGKAEILTSSLTSTVATSIANTYNMDVFIVTGITNLIVLGIVKMGINAWCRYFEEKYKKESKK